jgi:hypothetical protein
MANAWGGYNKNRWNYGQHSSTSSSWDQGASERGKKRQQPDHQEEEEHQPSYKVFSRQSGKETINPDGNRVERSDVTTVQQTTDFISMTNQAMWIVMEEPIPESYYTPWMRPAARLCQELESQYQCNQGLRKCELEHQNAKGQSSITYYEHDLRNHPWVQRKFRDEARQEAISVKNIHRITLS